MPYNYEYPRPSVTADCIVFGLDDSYNLKVLLIQRANPPFQHQWAIPGGFIEMEETLETAALRELQEETGVKDVFIEQLFTFGHPKRDPRDRVITVAYYALVNLEDHPVKAADDAKEVKWFDIKTLPELAFDHQKILKVAIERLRAKVRYQPIGFELLPEKFTLTALQKLYETILGVKINKRNFRTKFLKMGVLVKEEQQQGVAHRPAYLYRFDKEKYEALVKANDGGLLKKMVDFEI